MEPTTGYAEIGDQRVAYPVLGDGPIDVMGFDGQLQLYSVIQGAG